MMISVADVREVLGVDSNVDDFLIIKKIKLSYSLLSNMSSINMATSAADFKERVTLDDEMLFTLGINDATITRIDAVDVNGITKSVDLANVEQISGRIFGIDSSAGSFIRASVTYTNEDQLNALHEIAKDVTCYEYLKQAKKTGAISKTATNANNLTISFKTEKDFYNDVRERVGMIYRAGL